MPQNRSPWMRAGNNPLNPGSIVSSAASPQRGLIEQHVDDVVLISGAEADATAHLLWSELEVNTGDFGSAAVAALVECKVDLGDARSVAAVVTSGGGDAIFGTKRRPY